jgi:hypothetical protein
MITDEEMLAAQERLKAQRPEALALARMLRAAKRLPTLVVRCGAAKQACMMLAVWWTPKGALWWHPSVKRSARRAHQEGRDGARVIPEAAGLLADTVTAAGGGLLANLARCTHQQGDVASQELVERVAAAQRQGRGVTHRLGDADTYWVEFI